jgi:aryl-alcohol dehydrogenase-like predicted oxidoreductase
VNGVEVPGRGDVPYRTLGRTGERVSIIGLGGWHIGQPGLAEEESIRLIRQAIDGGITFMDNSWDYNEGASEVRMGKALWGGYRDKVFLMTKIDGRDKRSATSQLDESLRRLQTDHVDLLQFHEVIHEDDPRRIFAPGGALEAVVEARDREKVRFIGFTGHKSPGIHMDTLETAADHGFRFDAVQMPLNVMDAHFESFERKVLPVLVREGIGVLGMKSMGDKVIMESGTVTAAECLRYSLSLPTSVVITGIDSVPVLQQALSVARGFRPMTDDEKRDLLARTTMVASGGKYELYKISGKHDSTTANPQWLGEPVGSGMRKKV